MNTFKIYQESGLTAGPQWRWHLKASNGKIVAESGEGYANAADMVRVLRRHIVRDSSLLETALARALDRAALDLVGRVKP